MSVWLVLWSILPRVTIRKCQPQTLTTITPSRPCMRRSLYRLLSLLKCPCPIPTWTSRCQKSTFTEPRLRRTIIRISHRTWAPTRRRWPPSRVCIPALLRSPRLCQICPSTNRPFSPKYPPLRLSKRTLSAFLVRIWNTTVSTIRNLPGWAQPWSFLSPVPLPKIWTS